MSFAPERPSTEFIGMSQERQQQAQEQYRKVRESLTQATQEIVRYAQVSNPVVDIVGLTIAVDGALQSCVEQTLSRIDPRTGRVQRGGATWIDQRTLQRLENKLSQSNYRGGRRR